MILYFGPEIRDEMFRNAETCFILRQVIDHREVALWLEESEEPVQSCFTPDKQELIEAIQDLGFEIKTVDKPPSISLEPGVFLIVAEIVDSQVVFALYTVSSDPLDPCPAISS